MAQRIRVVDVGGHNVVPTIKCQTEANVAVGAIDAGMLVKWKSNGSPYVVPLVTGDHTIGTDAAIVGLCVGSGTQTAAADGYVEVQLPLPGVIYEADATTAANVNTQAEIDALVGDRVGIDVSATTAAGNWTIDEDEGEAQTFAFCIIGGDPARQTLKFIIRTGATFLGDQDLS